MDTREYRKYVKPLLWQDGPTGLYPEPLYWMEGARHMEGIGLCFAFSYVRSPGSFHPVAGMVRHPYDEVLVFASLNREDIRDLGAVCSIALGETGERYVIDRPTAVCIPAGLPHGSVVVERVERPFVHYALGRSASYAEERLPAAAGSPASGSPSGCVDTPGAHAHLLKDFVFAYDRDDPSEMGYALAVDGQGVAHPSDAGIGPGNADSLLWLFGKELEGFDLNFTWGHYSRCGKWHREGEVHTHPEEEAIFFVGLNPDDPADFQAEVEQGLGAEGGRYIIDRPSVYCLPPNLPHLPVLVRWVDSPYGLVVVGLSGEHASPWTVMVEDLL
jgi:hypothetical protein